MKPRTTKAAEPVAILVVNGGINLPFTHWLSLCLRKIKEHTASTDYHVYAWNNNPRDRFFSALAASGDPKLTLVSAGVPIESFHAEPMQILYEQARRRGHKYFITIDSDAHPISSNWLEKLISPLERGYVLSGIWRDELAPFIQPYVHPSCLATSFDFIQKHGFRLDEEFEDGRQHDTLLYLTQRVESMRLKIHKIKRSNGRNFHRLMGGIYGDVIYHHGAGTRDKLLWFWGEPKLSPISRANAYMRNKAASLLFDDYDRYIGWLRGKNSPVKDFVFNSSEIVSFDKKDSLFITSLLKKWGLNGCTGSSALPQSNPFAACFRAPTRENAEPWLFFHKQLVRLHKENPFPLIEYDLSNPQHLIERIAALAVTSCVTPDFARLHNHLPETTTTTERKKSVYELPAGHKRTLSYLRQNLFMPLPKIIYEKKSIEELMGSVP